MKAPIALFTYNRLKHTQNTINALLKNKEAAESDIYIFSDTCNNKKDRDDVIKTRKYLTTVKGFHSMEIIKADKNKGLAQSIIDGVSYVLKKHPYVIVLEDDLETSPYFLDFMNKALNFYKPTYIWSIAGYSPNIKIPHNYNYSTYLTHRNCSWGWATWKENWQKTDWDILDFDNFISKKSMRHLMNRGGNDLTVMLLKQQLGIINSWSIRFNYNGFKIGLPTVYPTHSLIQNKGADGSGTNIPTTTKYNTKLSIKQIVTSTFCTFTHFDKHLQNRFRKFYNTSLVRRIINYIRYKV